MSPKMTLRWLAFALVAISLGSIHAVAQDAPSVAEAARRARQQKQESAKPARVIDNDSLPAAPATSSPATAPAPASDSSSAPAAANASDSSASGTSGVNAADEEEKKAQIEALKQEIADKKERINLQQREMALAQDTYLSNPDHEHDTAGKSKLDSMQSDLSQLQAQLTDLQAKLAALGPSPETKTPETPKPPAS